MANFELDNEQVRVLKQAVNHELNDNSYCMGKAAPSTKKLLLAERKVLNGLYEMLSRRQISKVNEVEDNAENKE